MRDRKAAELLAGSIALRGGLDPFESALSAGIAAACYGRLFEPMRHARPPYALGFELGRHCLLDVARAALPSVSEAESVLGLCRSRANAN